MAALFRFAVVFQEEETATYAEALMSCECHTFFASFAVFCASSYFTTAFWSAVKSAEVVNYIVFFSQ